MPVEQVLFLLVVPNPHVLLQDDQELQSVQLGPVKSELTIKGGSRHKASFGRLRIKNTVVRTKLQFYKAITRFIRLFSVLLIETSNMNLNFN